MRGGGASTPPIAPSSPSQRNFSFSHFRHLSRHSTTSRCTSHTKEANTSIFGRCCIIGRRKRNNQRDMDETSSINQLSSSVPFTSLTTAHSHYEVNHRQHSFSSATKQHCSLSRVTIEEPSRLYAADDASARHSTTMESSGHDLELSINGTKEPSDRIDTGIFATEKL